MALAELLEAVERHLADARKRAATEALERRFEKITADLLARWEAAFYRLIRFDGMIAEAEPAARFASFSDAQWERVMSGAAGNYDEQAFELAGQSMLAGAQGVIEEFDLPSTFALPNPRAIAYLDDYGAKLVRQISNSTRDDMRRLLTNARAAGWSYEKTAKALQDKWGSLRVARPQQHIRSRAHMIAVTETAAAYEQGNLAVYRRMEAVGLPMEYSWLVAGDSRICPICDERGAAGWVSSAQWSGETPPAHPACRCSLLARVAAGGKAKLDAVRAQPPDAVNIEDFDPTYREWARVELTKLGYDPGAVFAMSKADAIRALTRAGWTRGQIVKGMRVTHSQVYQALKSVGRKPPPVRPPVRRPPPVRKPPPAPEPPPAPPVVELNDFEKLLKSYRDQGWSDDAIVSWVSRSTGRSTYDVRSYLRSLDRKLGAAKPPPTTPPLAGLSDLEQRILKWRGQGYSVQAIAEIEGISVANVRYYIRKANLRAGGQTAARAPRAGTRAAKRVGPAEPGDFRKPADLEEWLKPHLDESTLKQLSLKATDLETANELGLVFKRLIDDGFGPVLRSFSHIQIKSLGQKTYAHVWNRGYRYVATRWSRRLNDYVGGGSYQHHEIIFNSHWFGKGKRAQRLAQAARDKASGFHPAELPEFLDNSIASTAYHEMAHAIENFVVHRRGFRGTGVLRRKPAGFDDELVDLDGDWWGAHLDSMKRNSEYGKKNRQEKWAELFSEYYTGNRAAMDPVARTFIEDLIAAFKEAQQ